MANETTPKEKKTDNSGDKCARCGHPRYRHYSLNFADGPMISGEVLVCPAAIFSPEVGQ